MHVALNVFMRFSQKMPLKLFYTIVQKSQNRPKTQIKGSCFNTVLKVYLLLSYTRGLSRPFKEKNGLTTVSEEQELPGLRQTTASRQALCARSYWSVLFPPAFVELQMPQVGSLRVLQRGVLSSSSLCCRSFVVVFTFFLSKLYYYN